MAGIVAVIVKIMPDSLDVDLKSVEAGVRRELEREGALNISFESKDVAFGLKALFVKFAWDEEKDTSIFEEKLSEVNGVSSVNVEDYRRAFG